MKIYNFNKNDGEKSKIKFKKTKKDFKKLTVLEKRSFSEISIICLENQ